jgi:benzodiazapine receptor
MWPSGDSAGENVPMTVISQRSARTDTARSVLVAVLAVLQTVVAGLAGAGVLGAEPIGAVARAYRTPLLAAGWTFAIWGPIYLGILVYAVYQLLPAQRRRQVHRMTGWWMVAAGVFNTGWILSFGARWVPLAELAIIALLVCLAVVFGRLSRVPATGVAERVALRGPVALYTGWVSLATVLGTAATGVWAGLPGDGALAVVAAVVVLLAAAAIITWVVVSGTAVVGYAVAVVWGLIGIAFNDPPIGVAGAASLCVLLTAFAAARRVSASGNPMRAAFG